jgi:hypothetical protein
MEMAKFIRIHLCELNSCVLALLSYLFVIIYHSCDVTPKVTKYLRIKLYKS